MSGLLPSAIDNTYRGRPIGLWLLGFVLLVKAAQTVSVAIGGQDIVGGADGIPFETFSAEAVRTVVATWNGMGVSRMTICVLGALTLWRYRSAIPFVFALFAAHDVAREVVIQPIRTGAPVGPYVNWVLIVLMVLGVVFAVSGSSRRRQAATA